MKTNARSSVRSIHGRSGKRVAETAGSRRGTALRRPDAGNTLPFGARQQASGAGDFQSMVDNSPRQEALRERQQAQFGQALLGGSRLQGSRERPLPDAYQFKAKSGDRARTFEETAIDLVGTGSALHSLATAPVRTIGNAIMGLFSGFPSRATIRRQPVVQNAINTAWTAAQGDYAERFGWITWDSNNDTYAVPATSVGDQYSCTPPPKPADPAPNAANQVWHVGEFHIHPPLDPGEPGMGNPLDWPIGPSQTDEDAAQADNSPGIVRDFDTIARTGGVTDYTYGPWTRVR